MTGSEHAEGTTRQRDPQELARRFLALTERSQRLAQGVMARQARQASGAEFSLIDYQGVNRAFMEASLRLMADPWKLARAQMALWHDGMTLWQGVLGATAEGQAKAAAAAGSADRRFKDPAWSEQIPFDLLRRSYLMTARWMEGLVDDIEGLDPQTRAKVKFYTRQYLSALSPTNFALTNPQVLREIEKTGGENLLRGLENLLDDLERGGGRLQVSMTDEAAFELGRNVALTPGKVIFQNDLMQLIQYAPSTETVHKRPVLFVPPWINKFYVLDLQPKNSLIKWTVDQGHTLFVISWANPSQELAHKNFEDYMHEGPLAAIDAIERATGEREVNILGFCIGGILTVCTLAYMAAKGVDRIKAATVLATIIDFTDVGEASVFVDEGQLASMEKHMADKGYLEGHHMGDMFSMMREKDLIWFFVEQNYLLGRGPRPFDLLYWNADST
ncbi:MAG TPA: class I poly(R)-hydroxyalkanoic acid synthase, partial [Geminicoccaceae bacterium]|nr:class I poly(R)-hydroxyalkanoic acid synthase [Geminicoccaceae bacterium]